MRHRGLYELRMKVEKRVAGVFLRVLAAFSLVFCLNIPPPVSSGVSSQVVSEIFDILYRNAGRQAVGVANECRLNNIKDCTI